jgi:hypothetical protein
MNRSLANVAFGAFGGEGAKAAVTAGDRTARSVDAEQAAMMLAYAATVVVVPGYGLAVSQAQHQLRKLMGLLEERDVDVRYAIHPVAGRMPGHMNVLLAEADVLYDKLFDLDQFNDDFGRTDVVVVVGANDVVNHGGEEPRFHHRRHADPRRGQGSERDRREAEPLTRLRGDRQSVLLSGQHADVLLGREAGDERHGEGGAGSLSPLGETCWMGAAVDFTCS